MLNPKINLLPYREEKKKAIKIRYFIALGIAFLISLLSIGLVHAVFGMQMTNQEARNGILESDIASLDKQIEQIKKLRQEIAAAVARKQVVESLQANRSRAVMILNQIVQPPANIFYKSIKQSGENITITGIAPSNTSVSALIKQFETSDVFSDPKLIESKAINLENASVIDFTMSAKLINLAQVASDKNKKKAPTVAPSAGTASSSPNIIPTPPTSPTSSTSKSLTSTIPAASNVQMAPAGGVTLPAQPTEAAVGTAKDKSPAPATNATPAPAAASPK